MPVRSTAIEAFAGTTRIHVDGGASHDLLCDLGQDADREQFDFRAELQRVLDAWSEERVDKKQAAT